MTYNTLKLNQTILLSKWLETKSPYEPGTPAQAIADEASSALGFTVTVNNLKTVAEAVGYQLPPARKPKVDPMAELQDRVEELELKLKVHTHRLGTVIDDILKLQAHIQYIDPRVPNPPEDAMTVINSEPVPSIDGTLYM